MSSRDHTVYTLSPEVLFQEVDGEMVLLDRDGETYFSLNESGARIWRMLGEGQSLEAILDALEAAYEVDRASLEADVRGLLEQLRSVGLIRS